MPSHRRCSRLSTLNASAVSAAERWDAEVNYLRQVSDELAGAADVAGGSIGGVEAARAAVLAAHPRFPALVQVGRSCVEGGHVAAAPRVEPGPRMPMPPLWHVTPSPHLCTPAVLCCRLLQKYGELAPAAPRAAAGSALASSMAQLTICHGTKRVEKKLPGRYHRPIGGCLAWLALVMHLPEKKI